MGRGTIRPGSRPQALRSLALSSKKPVTEGPRQTGFRGDTPATDAISYKQPAATAPMPDVKPWFGSPGAPNRADMANPEQSVQKTQPPLRQQPPSGIAAVGSAGPSTVTYTPPVPAR